MKIVIIRGTQPETLDVGANMPVGCDCVRIEKRVKE